MACNMCLFYADSPMYVSMYVRTCVYVCGYLVHSVFYNKIIENEKNHKSSATNPF